MRAHSLESSPLPVLHTSSAVLGLEPGATLPGRSTDDSEILAAVARWAAEYLPRPHPELGRSGHVCPWVQASMAQGLFFLTIHRGETDPERLLPTFVGLQEQLLAMEPSQGRAATLKTIVNVFPEVPNEDAARIINAIHERLKRYFVDRGMMLGEFYADCDKEGLRNPAFRPLRSPIPLLVIRMMVPTDIAFLSDRPEYIKAYLKRFGAQGCNEAFSYLDNNRARISPERAALLLQTVHEAYPDLETRLPSKDRVTGLYTVDHLLKRLDAEIERQQLVGDESKRPPRISCCVLVFGLRDFEAHLEAGGSGTEAMLHFEVSRRAREALRAENILVSYGRNRFAVLIVDIPEEFIPAVAERLRARLEEKPFSCAGRNVDFSVAFGAAEVAITASTPAEAARETLARADAEFQRALTTRNR